MIREIKKNIRTFLLKEINKKYIKKAFALEFESKNSLKSLKDSHKGERCFIIGNGPSLNKCDLTKLKNEVTFGVNAIYLNYEKMGFYPTYYCVEDAFIAEDRSDEIKAYKGPKMKFFGVHLKKFLEGAIDATWMNVNMDYTEYPWTPLFSTDASKKLNVAGTVTYLNLQLAYYMGFEKVYMIGFDHHYVITKEGVIDKVNILSSKDDVSHFHKNYFGKSYRCRDPELERMDKGYKKAKKYFEKDGRKIYNATIGGHLEVFDRVDYDALFNQKGSLCL